MIFWKAAIRAYTNDAFSYSWTNGFVVSMWGGWIVSLNRHHGASDSRSWSNIG